MHTIRFASWLGAGAMASAVLAQDNPTPAAPAEEKKPKWETSASLGFTLTSGNSDSVLATAQALTQKKWDAHELKFGANAAYGETEDVKSAESIHGFGQYNRLFTERAFGYLRLDALHDSVADVEYRFLFSPGAGYYFIKTEKTRLSGEVGPGFVYEKQGKETEGYFTARIAENFEHKFSDRVRLWQSLEFLPQVDDFENFLINAEIGLESKLTEKLALKVFALDTYDNQPAPGRKENDIKLVTALGYTF